MRFHRGWQFETKICVHNKKRLFSVFTSAKLRSLPHVQFCAHKRQRRRDGRAYERRVARAAEPRDRAAAVKCFACASGLISAELINNAADRLDIRAAAERRRRRQSVSGKSGDVCANSIGTFETADGVCATRKRQRRERCNDDHRHNDRGACADVFRVTRRSSIKRLQSNDRSHKSKCSFFERATANINDNKRVNNWRSFT